MSEDKDVKADSGLATGFIIAAFFICMGLVAAYELKLFDPSTKSVTLAPKGAPIRGDIAKKSERKPVSNNGKKSPNSSTQKPDQNPPDDPAAFELPQKKALLAADKKRDEERRGKRDLQIKKAGAKLDVKKALATKNTRADLGFKTGERLKNGAVALGFDVLGDYNYVTQPPDIPKDKLPRQIPDAVTNFDGKRVQVRGFMLPIKVAEDGHVEQFFLFRDLASCCFGGYPKMNEWVYINVPKTMKVNMVAYAPIAVTGIISIGEKVEFGRVTSIYRLEADEFSKIKP
ncbi:MAG: DUF3299 domain-containing protein [Planctomycetota bacterium]|nr:DUF3299 domain-containing protein [Planctomycetota bacterium]